VPLLVALNAEELLDAGALQFIYQILKTMSIQTALKK
jgi:hypothetical protein